MHATLTMVVSSMLCNRLLNFPAILRLPFWLALQSPSQTAFHVPPCSPAADTAAALPHVQPKGTKAEMALCLLGVFGLKAATTIPVQLLCYVQLERSRRLAWDGPDAADVHNKVNTAIEQMLNADEEGWKHLKPTRVRGWGPWLW